MTFTFYLDDIEIEEPVGFADIALMIKRDPQWHGIFFEASTSDLQFYGDGATYLMDKKRNEGFEADVTFKAVVDCGGEDEIFSGKLDFRKYKEKCGINCFVVVPVEQEGCTMTMRNRYDQKVDLSDNVAFDKQTILPNYDGLNFAIELAPQEIAIADRAETGEDDITVNLKDDPTFAPDAFDDFTGYVTPAFTEIPNSSLGTFHTTPIIELVDDGANNIPPYPDFPTTIGTATLIGDVECDLDNAVATFRHKGVVNIQQSGAGETQNLKLKLWRLPAGLDATVAANWVQEYENYWYQTNTDGPIAFDISATVPLTLSQGDFIYYGIFVLANDLSEITSFTITQHKESFFELSTSAVCPPTNAVVSLIHETASRITEAITDHCLTVKSDYYGRTDSEPYAAEEDGCGSLRVLSNGLRIRNALTQPHFLSLKELYEGLNAIDNIGMGIEDAVIPYGPEVLRIEPAEHFYQDVEIIRHPAIPSAEFDAQPDLAYSNIKIGYKNWEIENTNGLDEFNSNKEFRTSLKSISNTLDQTSGFIAGGYPIENTRQQSFADTGAADTKYDNDTFIICVTRAAYAYGNYVAEQGNITSPSNMYSPSTAYNWRIRPMYNLIRWWKSVAQSYVNLLNTSSKLFFAAGVGNLLASGALADACNVANGVLPENHDLRQSDIANASDATPIWKPETMTYRYPMSLRDYNTIKANPKGYIFAQCGEFVKGFITNITYRIAKGDADITLRLKWDT